MSALTSIIIPNHNGCDMLRNCIESVEAHTQAPHEWIIVDNGSDDDSLPMLQEKRITFISLPQNRGFPAACNYGLRLAKGDTLLLLNNDVLVRDHWLENMLNCLNSAGDIGIVGPMSNYASGKQQSDAAFTNIDDMAARFHIEHKGESEQTNRIVGLCFLFRRELYEQIGPLDERYGLGYFEDDDFCLRARRSGWRLMIARDSYVYHHGGASFGKKDEAEVKQLIEHNRRLFMEKWSVDPLVFI